MPQTRGILLLHDLNIILGISDPLSNRTMNGVATAPYTLQSIQPTLANSPHPKHPPP